MKKLLAILLLISSLGFSQELKPLSQFLNEENINDIQNRIYISMRCSALALAGTKATFPFKDKDSNNSEVHKELYSMTERLYGVTVGYHLLQHDLDDSHQIAVLKAIQDDVDYLYETYREYFKETYLLNGTYTEDMRNEAEFCYAWSNNDEFHIEFRNDYEN